MKRLTATLLIILFSSSIFSQTREELYSRFSKAVSAHDTTAAASLVSNWERLYPNDAELFSLRANIHYMNAIFQVIVRSDEEPAAGTEYMVLQDSLGAKEYIYSEKRIDSARLRSAKSILAEGIARHPDRLDLRLGKITLHLNSEENGLAVQEIGSALERSIANNNKWSWTIDKPVETEGVSHLRDCIQEYLSQMLEMGDLASAERMVDDCIRLYPKDAVFLTDKGTLRVYAQDLESALKWYLKARKIAPEDMLIATNIANIYEKQGNKKKALKFYKIVAKSSDKRFAENAKNAIEFLNAE